MPLYKDVISPVFELGEKVQFKVKGTLEGVEVEAFGTGYIARMVLDGDFDPPRPTYSLCDNEELKGNFRWEKTHEQLSKIETDNPVDGLSELRNIKLEKKAKKKPA